ncbi:MAG: uncharacterized protein QOH15_1808 [Gaiellales bacterium]|nr:uncharacterized protein [Gaiellales bacterium]
MSGLEVGRLVGLWRYPVKSMAEESLDAVDVSWNGLAGDRRWAFIRAGTARNGFPWQTIRELPAMRHYLPSFAEPERPDDSRTMVRTPGGDVLEVADPALAAELGDGVRLIKQHVGVFDTMPLSLITTQTIANLGAWVEPTLTPERFRPNLLVEATGSEAFPEDGWVGTVIRIGEMRMRIDQRDVRCVMINIDPDTDEKDPDVLRTVARERDTYLGVYGATVTPGRVAVGDAVVLEA